MTGTAKFGEFPVDPFSELSRLVLHSTPKEPVSPDVADTFLSVD